MARRTRRRSPSPGYTWAPASHESSYNYAAPIAPVQTERDVVKELSGWDEFMEIAAKEATELSWKSSRQSDKAFTWTSNFKEAQKLASFGWPEGIAMVTAMYGQIGQVVGSYIRVPEVEYDRFGDELSHEEYAAGNPDHWMTFHDLTMEGKGRQVFRIVYNFGATGNVDASVLARRGAAAVVLAKALEAAGHGTEIWAVNSVTNGSPDRWEIRFKVKEVDREFDIDRIAFALIHPSTLRRLCFSVRENEPAEVRRRWGFGGSYGRSSTSIFQGDIYIDSATGSYGGPWETNDGAVQWIISALKHQGIELK